jgi:hypothetical protein
MFSLRSAAMNCGRDVRCIKVLMDWIGISYGLIEV